MEYHVHRADTKHLTSDPNYPPFFGLRLVPRWTDGKMAMVTVVRFENGNKRQDPQ
jgi:hypothetical protein